ncbi:MAG: hypothetical protein EXR76_17580 [Myxococcales bacterium]|nr:hypothetical protein [Myxococcales bacterium]
MEEALALTFVTPIDREDLKKLSDELDDVLDLTSAAARGWVLRKMEKESDHVYREAIRTLFHDPAIDAKTLLREKEMLDNLERAVDRCEHAGETMAHLAIKHG